MKVVLLSREVDSEIVGIYETIAAAISAAYPKRGEYVAPVVTAHEIRDDGLSVITVDAGGYTYFAEEYNVIPEKTEKIVDFGGAGAETRIHNELPDVIVCTPETEARARAVAGWADMDLGRSFGQGDFGGGYNPRIVIKEK